VADSSDSLLVTIDGTEYPVRVPEATARQVAIIRALHGRSPRELVAMVHDEVADLPEICALAHLSKLQDGDVDFDGGALLDSVTLGSSVVVDALPDGYGAAAPEDADPQP
jgi:hypothetical protein